MLGEMAIIALAIFNQFNLINADDNRKVFLGQFVRFDNAASGAVKGDVWAPLANPYAESKLEILPRKSKEGDLDIKVVSALVMDAGTDFVMFEKNSNKRMPIASLSKIMTSVVVLENSSFNDTVKISQNAMQTFGDKKGMTAGEEIKLEDLFRLMIIDSNNAAAVALAEHSAGSVENFVVLMNKKAEALGLENTHFVNPTGLDAGGEGNYSTARDVAQLVDYALPKSVIWDASRMREAAFFSIDGKQRHYVKNTNELLGKIDRIYGGKTGYTINAGECLMLISETPDRRHKTISVVLNAENRFTEMQKLVNWVFDVYSWQ